MVILRIFLVNVGLRPPLYPLVTPPMGLLYLAAYLRSKFDAAIHILNQRLENCPPAEVVRQAREFNADVVGFSVMTTTAYLLPDLVKQTREALPNALIVLGGPHVSSVGAEVMEQVAADAAVPGEGERTFESILHAWKCGAGFEGIPGLIWREKSGEIHTNPGFVEQMEDVDAIPRPAYDLIDLPAYWRQQSIVPVTRRRYVSLVSSRGCPYRCVWCHNIFGKSIRMHSPERMVEEIEYFQRTYGVNEFEFLDDNFNLRVPRMIQFSEQLRRRGIHVKLAFPTALRGDILTQEGVDALKEAGMYMCAFSLESGSPRIQELTQKHLNIPKFLQNVKMAAAKRVYVVGFCMMGFPTETEEELQQTIDIASASDFHTASFFTVTPFPGTPIYAMVKERNPEKLAHVRYDDMDFSNMRVNLTDLPDQVLYAYQRKAQRTFFFNARRIRRLLRDYPKPFALPLYLPIFLLRATKGVKGFS